MQRAKNNMDKLIAQFLQFIQLYTLFKVSPEHAFVVRPMLDEKKAISAFK